MNKLYIPRFKKFLIGIFLKLNFTSVLFTTGSYSYVRYVNTKFIVYANDVTQAAPTRPLLSFFTNKSINI